MSWHYSSAEGAEHWDPCSSDSIPDALSKLFPKRVIRYYAGKPKGTFQPFLFGMMWRRSTVARGVVKSTSSPEGSRVPTSVQRVGVRESPEEILDSFSRCCESLKRYGLTLSSRKTVRTYVPKGSVLFSMDLPVWGMMLDGGCWELGTSVRTITERECGLSLLTPTGQGNEFGPSMQKWPGHRRLLDWLADLPTPVSSEVGRGTCPGEMRRRSPMLKARLIAAMKEGVVPTPTAKLYGSNKGGSAGREGKDRPSLESLVGGIFLGLREWMMGVPIGWTSRKPLPEWRWKEWKNCHGIETRESS